VKAFHYVVSLRDPHLLLLLAEARCFLAMVEPTHLSHIPRSSNALADALANRAVDLLTSNFELAPPLPWFTAPERPNMSLFTDPSGVLPPPIQGGGPTLPAEISGLTLPSPSDISLPEPNTFQAGSLSLFADRWDDICSHTSRGSDVRNWARHG
jgi:hypothetical protein